MPGADMYDRAWIVQGCQIRADHAPVDQRAGRMLGLERLIQAIKAEPGVWWATCKQVAEWQIETRQNLDVTVPIP